MIHHLKSELQINNLQELNGLKISHMKQVDGLCPVTFSDSWNTSSNNNRGELT